MDQPDPRINTLPPEVLSTIFLLLRQIRRYPQLLPFQVKLSHVCQHWRQVAVSTPQLWSSITLFSAGSQPCAYEWLKRSRTVPLDVRLDLYSADYRGELNPAWIEDNLSRIAHIVDRFQNLFLITFQEVNVYHILQLFQQAKAPLLERLRVHIGNHEHLQELHPFITPNHDFTLSTTFGGGLPKLTFTELKPLRCIPPLTSITALHLNFVGGQPAVLSFNQLVEILRMPQSLVTLSLRGSVATDGWPLQRDRPSITLPELRNLELSSNGATGVRFIIFFGAPNLESLRWHVNSDNYHLLLESPQFQPDANKFPKLRYLTLVAQPLTPYHLERLMRVFPTPTHILCTHSLTPRLTFKHLDPLLDAPRLEVLALQRMFEPRSGAAAQALQNALTGRQRIKKILVDTELLAYLKSYGPGITSMVDLDEINKHTFPDYWRISRSLDTPDRL
ncbi:hypothetical protein D9756_005463 [Leucocoprinus leucothites]|uniref:F-box domain-containing protein n=1 Tax=Leucocoprinus leucothites TaxID=201217 RepID=A0A8H5D824_9AGAR|nr:hypothetical protein D9756_005463 [Leucoagaricus leucothites]